MDLYFYISSVYVHLYFVLFWNKKLIIKINKIFRGIFQEIFQGSPGYVSSKILIFLEIKYVEKKINPYLE